MVIFIPKDYPWPPDKAPWARERGGSGIPPPGAVATVNLNDEKDGKISLPSGPAPGLGTSVEPGSIATAGGNSSNFNQQ